MVAEYHHIFGSVMNYSSSKHMGKICFSLYSVKFME